MTRDPGAGLGLVQRFLLLLLADGTARSVERIAMDSRMDEGRARGALAGLGRRGLVDRDHTSGTSSGRMLILWSLSAEGQEVATRLHHLGDEEGEDATPRCPHGQPEDWPCKACRVGPWRCPDCGHLVRGGQRALHRREVHGETRYRPGRIAWSWAAEAPR